METQWPLQGGSWMSAQLVSSPLLQLGWKFLGSQRTPEHTMPVVPLVEPPVVPEVEPVPVELPELAPELAPELDPEAALEVVSAGSTAVKQQPDRASIRAATRMR
jgi:hypothetical protein